jgi:hypothetical protein
MEDEQVSFAPDDPMSLYAFLSLAELRKQCKEGMGPAAVAVLSPVSLREGFSV